MSDSIEQLGSAVQDVLRAKDAEISRLTRELDEAKEEAFNLNAVINELKYELAGAKAVIARLTKGAPITKDGVVIVPKMKVYRFDKHDNKVLAYTVTKQSEWGDGDDWDDDDNDTSGDVVPWAFNGGVGRDAQRCYSTRKLAEAAIAADTIILEDAIDRAISALADIAGSSDMNLTIARRKAARVRVDIRRAIKYDTRAWARDAAAIRKRGNE